MVERIGMNTDLNTTLQDVHKRLLTQFPLGELHIQKPGLGFATIDQAQLPSLLRHLRDREGFSHLVLMTAVDWLEEGQFQLTYLLCNRTQALDLGVRIFIDRAQARMESIHQLWPTAATYQRELWEMFGIDFPGSPGQHEPFILEGWNDIPPYRRDFDTLKYARETYSERPGRETHDPATYMKARLYPEIPKPASLSPDGPKNEGN
jgi:NADH-quinone oxidoreductase subunit C